MRVVVTGAAGMLARAARRALADAGHEVVAPSEAEADVTSLAAMRSLARDARADWWWNLAAFTRVDDCESQADRAYLVNALGAGHVAQAAAETGAAVLHVSTDYVFDGRGTAPYREWDPTGPRSVYGASKLAGEHAVRAVNPRHLIVRTAWLFGAGGPNFVDTILRKARAGEALRVVDDQRGSPTWTEDLAAALVRLTAAGVLGTGHVTNRGECTWYAFARFFLERAGVAASLEPCDTGAFPRPAPRPAYSVLSPMWYEHVSGATMPPWQDAVTRYLAGAGA